MDKRQFLKTSIGLLGVGMIINNVVAKTRNQQLEEIINEHLAVMQDSIEECRIKQIRVPQQLWKTYMDKLESLFKEYRYEII